MLAVLAHTISLNLIWIVIFLGIRHFDNLAAHDFVVPEAVPAPLRAARDSQPSTMMKAMRELNNSPAMKAARELEKLARTTRWAS
jgi:hypothetical protein